MVAFTPSVAVTASKTTLGSSSFVTPHPSHNETSPSNAPSMALRVGFARKSVGISGGGFGVAGILSKAEDYMAKSVLKQYQQMSNPAGVYGVTCTEGTVKGAAEGTRVRALNIAFRNSQKSPFKKYGDIYEYRKEALAADGLCTYESKLFCNYSKVSETYCIARAEALGTCDRYATPETVEEAAMVRYMDIQQKNALNSSGVYTSYCNEGAFTGQAEDLRVNSLAVAYRNGMKPMAQILQEKYNQKQHGYSKTRGCTYEDGLITAYPALGAGMRSKAAGY